MLARWARIELIVLDELGYTPFPTLIPVLSVILHI
jgi:hypothetical protein